MRSNGELLDRLRAQWLELCRLSAEVATVVGEVHATGAVSHDGAASTVAWLVAQLRLDHGQAAGLVRVGSALASHSEVAAALAAGEISVAAAEAVLSGPDEAEKVLLDLARDVAPAQVRKAARYARYLAAPDEADRREAYLHAERGLTVATTVAGAVSVQGVFDPTAGEVIRAALAAYTAGPDPDGERTASQRRADAWTDICRVALCALDRPLAGGDRPQVTVTMSLDSLRGGRVPALLGTSGEPVGAGQARRIACDSSVIPVVLGSASEPLDIGRQTRVVPAGLRRAVWLPDGHCRFPGCDRPPQWTDVHHLRHWADGGATKLDNLILLCQFHHTLVHAGWTIHLDRVTGAVRVRRPDGAWLHITGPPGR